MVIEDADAENSSSGSSHDSSKNPVNTELVNDSFVESEKKEENYEGVDDECEEVFLNL